MTSGIRYIGDARLDDFTVSALTKMNWMSGLIVYDDDDTCDIQYQKKIKSLGQRRTFGQENNTPSTYCTVLHYLGVRL
jgi:hypothetical protein